LGYVLQKKTKYSELYSGGGNSKTLYGPRRREKRLSGIDPATAPEVKPRLSNLISESDPEKGPNKKNDGLGEIVSAFLTEIFKNNSVIFVIGIKVGRILADHLCGDSNFESSSLSTRFESRPRGNALFGDRSGENAILSEYGSLSNEFCACLCFVLFSPLEIRVLGGRVYFFSEFRETEVSRHDAGLEGVSETIFEADGREEEAREAYLRLTSNLHKEIYVHFEKMTQKCAELLALTLLRFGVCENDVEDREDDNTVNMPKEGPDRTTYVKVENRRASKAFWTDSKKSNEPFACLFSIDFERRDPDSAKRVRKTLLFLTLVFFFETALEVVRKVHVEKYGEFSTGASLDFVDDSISAYAVLLFDRFFRIFSKKMDADTRRLFEKLCSFRSTAPTAKSVRGIGMLDKFESIFFESD
jgi:hypothetical protein